MAAEKPKIKGDPKKPINKRMLDEAVRVILKEMDNLLDDIGNKIEPLS